MASPLNHRSNLRTFYCHLLTNNTAINFASYLKCIKYLLSINSLSNCIDLKITFEFYWQKVWPFFNSKFLKEFRNKKSFFYWRERCYELYWNVHLWMSFCPNFPFYQLFLLSLADFIEIFFSIYLLLKWFWLWFLIEIMDWSEFSAFNKIICEWMWNDFNFFHISLGLIWIMWNFSDFELSIAIQLVEFLLNR